MTELLFSAVGAHSDDDFRQLFGENAVVTRVGKYNLIHLDNPPEDVIKERIRRITDEFESFIEDDCPICQMFKEQGGNIVFD